MNRRLALAAFTVLLTGSLLGSDAAYAKSQRSRGETVEITGRVTDTSGQPVTGVEVVLEAYHRKLDLRQMKRRDTDLLQVVATTDQNGSYRLEWAWNDHYGIFYLATALPTRSQGRSQLEIFSRQEITEVMRAAGPVRRDLAITNADTVRWLQRFLGGQTSQAERQVYEQMGRPDRVDPEDSAGETAWWYFAAGKVYRFRGDELARVIEFEPIPDS